MRLPAYIHLRGSLLASGLAALMALIAVTGRDFRQSAYVIEADLKLSAPAQFQLFYDVGRGFNEADSVTISVEATPNVQTVQWPISGGTLQALRLDPGNRPTSLTLEELELRRQGSSWHVFDLASVRAGHEIASLDRHGRALSISTLPGASDPSVVLSLDRPIELEFGPGLWGSRFILVLLSAGLVAWLLFGLRWPPSGRTPAQHARVWADRHPRLASLLWIPPIWLGAFVALPLPPDHGLDASWQMTLIHARELGLQFGRDLVFTAGPWGFLFSHFYLEPGLGLKLGFEIFGKLALAAAFVFSTRPLSWGHRALLLGATVLFGGLVLDTWLILLASLLIMTVLLRDSARPWVAVTLLLLGFLGLVKFTLLVLGAAGVAVAAASRLWRGQGRTALSLIAGYGAALLGWWLAAGQNPIRLPRFLSLSGEISRGYAGAMSLPTPPAVGFVAFLVLLGFVVWLWQQIRRAPRDLRAIVWPSTAVAAGTVAIVWKHGLTRADGHALIFFFVAGLLALTLPALFPTTPRARFRLEWVAPLCLLGGWYVDDSIIARSGAIAWSRASSSLYWISHPQEYMEQWKRHAHARAADLALPKVRAQVGNATIDAYNYRQGELLLNNLNYRPRLIIQGYSAYTEELARRNLGWIQREDRAPEYFLIDLTTIDGRLPTMDDAQLLADLPRRYQFVLREQDRLLLQRRPDQPAEDGLPRHPLVHRHWVNFGEEVPLPLGVPHALWLRADCQPTWLGTLWSALYKPEPLWIVVTLIDGQSRSFRIVPKVSASGFLLQPLIADLADFESLLAQRGRHWVRSFRLEPSPGDAELWSHYELEISALPTLEIPGAQNAAVIATGVANVVPDRLELQVPAEFFDVDGRPAMLAHSPAQIRFPIPAGSTRFQAGYGLREGAATGPGDSDGVTFRIEYASPEGGRTELWRRHLDPGQRPADRGPQTVDLASLPAAAGGQLWLITEPGPADDSRWDWSYWSDMTFAQ